MQTSFPKWRLLIYLSVITAYLVIVLNISYLQDRCPSGTTQALPVDKNELETLNHRHVVFDQHLKKTLHEERLIPAVPPKTEHQHNNKILDARNRPHYRLLSPDYAPNTVHYVWCGKKWFEFHHYLSVMSVIRELAPDVIYIHYQYYPYRDNLYYNTWLEDIIDEFPFLIMKEIPKNEIGCKQDGVTPNLDFVMKNLRKTGGLFVRENTVLADFPIQLRNHTFVNALDHRSMNGFLLSKGNDFGRSTIDEIMRNTRYKTKSLHCGTPESVVTFKKQPTCVVIDQVLYPKDIWDLDDAFGRLARQVFYGRPDIPKPNQSEDDLVPNIAHICWIGGGGMDFLFYLSVLSLLYVAKVDVVYIHGSAPTGHYWDSIKNHERIVVILRETPKTVYGNRVHVLSHVTDVWRVDFMVKYGGIYVDTDTVFVKPLDRQIRSYDAVGSYDWTDWHYPFPDIVNFGVAVGKRNATFWRLFQESMHHFVDADWALNGLRKPYKIKERHPKLLKIDPRLQVICFRLKCHPTWYPGYHNESIHHRNTDSIRNWRKDVYAFHWTLPTPPELKSEDALMNTSGMFAEIGKYILRSAGKIL